MNQNIENFFDKESKWQESFAELRKILLETGLTEEIKWGCPCYTSESRNIVLIHGFKDYCALLFMKGAFINDTYSLLVQQTENVQSSRQIRFTQTLDVMKYKAIINEYVIEAINIEKSGLKVTKKNVNEYEVPEEFQMKLIESPGLKVAFESLTPGRRRAYLLYFSSAKQSKTRQARIEKCIPKIINGKGLDD